MLQLLPFLYKQQLNKIKFLHANPLWKISLSPDRAKNRFTYVFKWKVFSFAIFYHLSKCQIGKNWTSVQEENACPGREKFPHSIAREIIIATSLKFSAPPRVWPHEAWSLQWPGAWSIQSHNIYKKIIELIILKKHRVITYRGAKPCRLL